MVHVASKGWSPPYIIGYVDLPEGVRLFGHVLIQDPAGLKPDMPVAVDLPPYSDQTAIDIRIRFTPLSPVKTQ